MKKSILDLGKVLDKKEQKEINGKGGKPIDCSFSDDPSTDWCCHFGC